MNVSKHEAKIRIVKNEVVEITQQFMFDNFWGKQHLVKDSCKRQPDKKHQEIYIHSYGSPPPKNIEIKLNQVYDK